MEGFPYRNIIYSDEERINYFKKLQNMNLVKYCNEKTHIYPNINLHPVDYLLNGRYNYIMYNPKDYMLSYLFNDVYRAI